MYSAMPLFTAALVLTSALAGVALWSPRVLRAKLLALGLAALVLPLSYFSLMELLGRPKPIELEWRAEALGDAEVVASRLREGEAIYLWLQVDGTTAPRSYRLPWDLDTARQLYAAQQAAEAGGTPIRMRRTGQATSPADAEPTFYAEPQPRLPAKS